MAIPDIRGTETLAEATPSVPQESAPHQSTRISRRRLSPLRRLIETAVLLTSILLLFRALAAEPYGVPTGSMAPALAGNHKATTCPRCGYRAIVGDYFRLEAYGTAAKNYVLATCPNCGCGDLSLETVAECRGDQLLVNKYVFDLRRPRRWEMAAFRSPADPARAFVKRVVGLPGETVQIRGGDLYIDRSLCRKSLASCKAVRIPVFDINYQPPEGWQDRWLAEPPGSAGKLERGTLRLESDADADAQWLTYRHWLVDEGREQALDDRYGYNASGWTFHHHAVQDFMWEADIQINGKGWLLLSITDGLDTVVAELPIGPGTTGTRLADAHGVLRSAPTHSLVSGRTYHIDFSFMDRRVILAIDGFHPFEAVDLPPADQRREVSRPARIGSRGVRLAARNFRLYRDIHYLEAGEHGVQAPVLLGAGEYFVLGDNSPNSDDSRFWPDPAVPEANFLGKPFLVHLPSRTVHWGVFGRHWEFQGPDWGRIRWIR